MPNLKELVAEEIEKGTKHIPIDQLYGALKQTPGYNPEKEEVPITVLTDGMFVHALAVLGNWQEEDKDLIKRIASAGPQFDNWSTYVGVAESRAYQTLSEMHPGDINKIGMGDIEYHLVMFPSENPLTTGIALFVNPPEKKQEKPILSRMWEGIRDYLLK